MSSPARRMLAPGSMLDGYPDLVALCLADLLDDHRVRAFGHRCAGEDARRRAGRKGMPGDSRGDALGDPQAAAACSQVGGAHRVAVHGAVVPAGDVDGADHRLGQHPPEAVHRWQGLDVRDRPGLGEEQLQGLLHGQERAGSGRLAAVVVGAHFGNFR